MKNLFLPLILSFIFITTGIQAQNATTYESILQSYFTAKGPGAAALVVKDGKVLYSGAVGKANIELDVDMNANHVFRIGSVSKQFTAVAILMLMEQGKLDLQDDITRHLPDYPNQGKKITIEHLLTHTSGIQSYTNMSNFADIAYKKMSTTEMVDFFKNEPMEFDPGTKYNYNNSGYYLLGVIIEKISGLSYADFIQQNIFDVAGMSESYYGSHTPIIKNRASGYADSGTGVTNSIYISMDWPYAAGALLSTVGDLYKWNTALHEGKFIKKTSLEKAFNNYKLQNGDEIDYGYGWSLSNLFGNKSYEHGGRIQGFLSYALYVPEEDVFVATLSNCTCQSADGAAAHLAAHAIGKAPQAVSIIKAETKKLEEYVGVYEIAPGDQRQIILKDGMLYSQRSGGKYQITAYAKDKFNIEKSLTIFEFSRDPNGKVTSMKAITRTGYEEDAKRVSDKVVERKEITLDQKILESYVGVYELMPNFALDVTQQDGQLFIQATGQSRFPAFAESETKFFLKVVPAQIEFFKNEKGEIHKLVLYQNGMEMPGMKK